MPAKLGMRKDYTGKRYGRLTAVEYVGKTGHAAKWKFICDCGNEVIKRIDKVAKLQNASCGCYYEDYLQTLHENKLKREAEKQAIKDALKCDKKMKTKLYRDLTGEKHGHLFVFEKLTDGYGPEIEYNCLCECGNEVIKTQKYLTDTTNMLSCGCTRKYKRSEFIRAHDRIADIYRGMIERCYNPNCPGYEYYGARGIKVCSWWLDKNDGLERFIRWSLKHGYQDDLSIDRINVDGNYEPSNCRWIPMSEQAKNTRRNHFLTAHWKTQTMSDWARETGINVDVIKDRVNRLNWSDEEAVSIPTMRMGGKRWLVK